MVDLVALTLRYLYIAFGIAWIGGLAYGVVVLRLALLRADRAGHLKRQTQ